jgi:hypothetical protein
VLWGAVVSLAEIAALMRRHVLAVAVVLVLAAGLAYSVKRTPVTYQESATVIFTAPISVQNPNPYDSYSGTLITAAEVLCRWIMGVQGQQQVRDAGATGTFNVALVNLYNQEYPNYSDPDVTVTATAGDPDTVHSTFAIVSRLLNDDLVAREVQDGVAPVNRIGMYAAGDTGPLEQTGTPKRAFAGLFALTIAALLVVSMFLDRYPIRPRSLIRSWRRGAPDQGARPAAARVRPDTG